MNLGTCSNRLKSVRLVSGSMGRETRNVDRSGRWRHVSIDHNYPGGGKPNSINGPVLHAPCFLQLSSMLWNIINFSCSLHAGVPFCQYLPQQVNALRSPAGQVLQGCRPPTTVRRRKCNTPFRRGHIIPELLLAGNAASHA